MSHKQHQAPSELSSTIYAILLFLAFLLCFILFVSCMAHNEPFIDTFNDIIDEDLERGRPRPGKRSRLRSLNSYGTADTLVEDQDDLDYEYDRYRNPEIERPIYQSYRTSQGIRWGDQQNKRPRFV